MLSDMFYALGSDKLIFVWDLANGDIIGQFKGHTDTIHCLCYSRDSSVLASGRSKGQIRICLSREQLNITDINIFNLTGGLDMFIKRTT